ncbi:MAG TPA: histidine kinase, partial [Flavobacterium sp.]|nr:histidine kinase [Flavobacterium sp.]
GLLYHNGQLYFHDNRHGLAKIAAIHSAPEAIVANNYEDIHPNNDHFENIFVDSRDRIWCTDFNNIKYIKGKKVSRAFVYDAKNNGIENGVSFIEPIAGNVWAFTRKGLFIWNELDNRLKRHPDPDIGILSYVSAFKSDVHHILFALHDGRIGNIDIRTHRVSWLPKLPVGDAVLGFGMLAGEKPVIYTRQQIYTMAQDHYGYSVLYSAVQSQINHVLSDKRTRLLWVSTNKGLVKLTPVEAITDFKIPQAGIGGNPVGTIEQYGKSKIWLIGKQNIIWSVDSDKQWQSYECAEKDVHFSNINICDETVLLASDKGLFEVKGNAIAKINLPDLPAGTIKKTLISKNKELWLLYANSEIQRYRWPSLSKIETPFANTNLLWAENTWNDMLENTDGTIWLAGWSPKSYGMFFYDRDKNRFIDNSDLKANADRRKYFGDYVNRIATAKNGELLFSGYGGFNFVEADGNIRKLVDINNYPIANGRIEGIALDNDNNVVFATGDGLHVYHPASDEIIRISQADGLLTDDLIYGFKKLNDGTFALGTDNGFTVIDIKKLLEPKNLNRLELTEIKVDGIARETTSKSIELSKDENDMTLYFSNLSFSDKQKVLYRYKFKGDKHWNALGNNPELTLNHIVPGNYELTIETGNHMGHWQSKTLKLEMVAHPPFYRSAWFFVLLAAIAIAIVVLMNRRFLARQRKEAQYMQKIRESEMQTLRAQMNPHFMFNTLNSINSFIIENKTEAASGYLTTFSKLMRNILEYSKEESISLSHELQALKLYLELEAVRLEHSFDYTIEVAKKIRNNEMVKVPPLILQPFVENAIWHGLNHKPTPGNLYISVAEENQKLVIRIEDDGIGREAAKRLKKQQTSHKSYGIEITLQRILMLHPENAVEILDLADENGNPSGTAVVITLKI